MLEIKTPRGEIIWMTYYKNEKLKYVITSKPTREWYFLYEVSKTGSLTKKEKAKTPIEFKQIYN